MDEGSESPEPYLVPDLQLFLLAVAGLYTPGQGVRVSGGAHQATRTVAAAADQQGNTVVPIRAKEDASDAKGR